MIGAVNVIALIIWLYLYSQKEVRYVDRSGIASNPPTFIETWENKTINFNYDGKQIKICHMPLPETLKYINKIARIYQTLYLYFEQIKEDAYGGQKLSSKQIIELVDEIAITIYHLSKPHLRIWERIGRKKWIIKKARGDIDFVLGICGETFDYMQYLGNALRSLSQGATSRMMYGKKSSWNTIKRDIHGKRLLEPMHDLSAFIQTTSQN